MIHHKHINKVNKTSLLVILIAASFLSGFAFKTVLVRENEAPKKKKVTGIGGIFFKCKDPVKMRAWYQEHLGLNTNQYGAVFEWYQGADSTRKGYTTWSPFKETTKYFAPSAKDFMINYRVADLEALLKELKTSGITVLDTMETYDYGKFAHILDAEGNKVELWEPNDTEYEKLGKQLGSPTTK